MNQVLAKCSLISGQRHLHNCHVGEMEKPIWKISWQEELAHSTAFKKRSYHATEVTNLILLLYKINHVTWTDEEWTNSGLTNWNCVQHVRSFLSFKYLWPCANLHRSKYKYSQVNHAGHVSPRVRNIARQIVLPELPAEMMVVEKHLHLCFV